MTPSITAEQRARIAREVTGHEWIINAEENCIECFTGYQGLPYACWHPDFHPDDVNSRSQALDIIGWLADRIGRLEGGMWQYKRNMRIRLHEAIRFRNIGDMEEMVLELGNG